MSDQHTFQITRKVQLQDDPDSEVRLLTYSHDEVCVLCDRAVPVGEEFVNLGDPDEIIAPVCTRCVKVVDTV